MTIKSNFCLNSYFFILSGLPHTQGIKDNSGYFDFFFTQEDSRTVLIFNKSLNNKKNNNLKTKLFLNLECDLVDPV